jgi:DNA-binding response OmpR family regulator
MRILIVEDEPTLAEHLAKGLRRHGFAVDVAPDGETGLYEAMTNSYDVVVLDRDLPKMHGDDVCAELRSARRPSRIMMLTAARSTDDLVHGFRVGADDYLGKPFAFAELLARVTALGRRSPTASRSMTFADLTLDVDAGKLTRGGHPVVLTAREFAVLEHLVRADGRTVSAEELLEHVWDANADPFTTSVRVLMSRLRSKIGSPDVIETVIGRGYRMTLPA